MFARANTARQLHDRDDSECPQRCRGVSATVSRELAGRSSSSTTAATAAVPATTNTAATTANTAATTTNTATADANTTAATTTVRVKPTVSSCSEQHAVFGGWSA